MTRTAASSTIPIAWMIGAGHDDCRRRYDDVECERDLREDLSSSSKAEGLAALLFETVKSGRNTEPEPTQSNT